MRKILILLFCASFILGQDYNPQQYESTVVSGDDSVIVDLYSAFGIVDQGNELKLIGLFTDATMTSTALTFEVYDEKNDSYKTLKDFDSGNDLSYTIAASEYFPLDPRYFAGVRKLVLRFGSSEAANRSIVLIGRVF